MLKTLDKIEDQFKSTRKVAEQFAVATKGVERATSAAGKAAERTWPKISKFASAIGRIAKYRLIRSIIRGITDAIKEGADNFYKYSKDVGAPFAESMDNVKSAALTMKNQLGSAFGELFQIITPIILDLIGYITQLASVLSMVYAALSGKGGWYKAKEGLDAVADSAGGAGSAAKEALKYLAPFDELNRLPSDNGSGGGGGSSSGGLSDMFDFQEWEEDSAWGKIAQYVRENLEAIELLVDIFGFSIGVAMLLSGHIGYGLGLMLYFGYKGVQAVSENWGTIKTQMQGSIGEITAIVSGALLVLGAALTFSGASIPIGLGMMVAGAAGLATAVVANWSSIKTALEGPIGEVTAIISSATLVLGILLLIAGAWPIGLGLIVAGAAGLAATAAANWDNIKKIGSDAVDKIKEGWDAAKENTKLEIKAAVDLVKNWTVSLKEWVSGKADGTFYGVHAGIGLVKNWTKPLKEWVSGKADGKFFGVYSAIGLVKNWTKPLKEWVSGKADGKFFGVYAAIGLVKNGWQSVSAWIKNNKLIGAAVEIGVSLVRGGWQSVSAWIKNNKFIGSAIEIGVKLVQSGWSTVKSWLSNLAGTLGIDITFNAGGGVFENGKWSDIPQFAGGGSLFVAGEAGPEVVGHFNNRTEVLNQSQMAAAIASGVAETMASVRFSLMGLPSSGDNGDMYEAIYSAMSRALAENADDRPIMLDGDVMYRNMVRRNRQETFRSGMNPMMSTA